MARSKNNFITLEEMFTGSHPLLEKAFSPMTIRFYMLQAHYSSPVDFSNEALKAAEQGMGRLMKAMNVLSKLKPSGTSSDDIRRLIENAYTALSDDMNTPIVLGYLFEAVKIINSVNDGKAGIDAESLEALKNFMQTFVFELLGLVPENDLDDNLLDGVINLLLDLRKKAKEKQDFSTSDQIRDQLLNLGILVKDTKSGPVWERQ
jgi:cysteinyl-tRNA synthetase